MRYTTDNNMYIVLLMLKRHVAGTDQTYLMVRIFPFGFPIILIWLYIFLFDFVEWVITW